MSGTAPPPAGGQAQSMDDILASIRRILNEDEAAAQTADSAEPDAAPEPPTPPPAAPVQQTAPPPAAPPPRTPTPEPVAQPPAPPPVGPGLDRAPPAPRAEPEALELTSEMLVTPPSPAALPSSRPGFSDAASAPRMGMDDASGLIAPVAAAAAAASVGSLLRAVSSERGSQVYRGGPSIEDLVREEIRPILKDWLDMHLPPLVERLVRAEIERVVNRGLT